MVGEEVTTDGKSLLPLLKGDQNHYHRETAFVYYDPRWGKNVNRHRNQFVRTKRYKLYQDGEFYDLDKDVLELNPLQRDSLSKDEQLILQNLQKELSFHPEWN